MFYTVYRITHTKSNKEYIGVHQTKNLDDDYMGSGTLLKRAQKRHGIENFTKEILEVFDNPEDMFNMESTLVDTIYVLREDTYNLKIGGVGGSAGYIKSDETRAKLSALAKGRVCTEEHKNNLKRAWASRTMSDEHKKKLFESRKGCYKTGKDSPNYETLWIYNLDIKESKRIKKDKLPEFLAKGWLKGRKIKF